MSVDISDEAYNIASKKAETIWDEMEEDYGTYGPLGDLAGAVKKQWEEIPGVHERELTKREKEMRQDIQELGGKLGAAFGPAMQKKIQKRLQTLGLKGEIPGLEALGEGAGEDEGKKAGRRAQQAASLELETSRFMTGRGPSQPPWVKELTKPQEKTAQEVAKMRVIQKQTLRFFQQAWKQPAGMFVAANIGG